MSLEDSERELIEMIMLIQRDYQKQIDPYLKRLANIRALRPAPPFVVDLGELSPDIRKRLEEMTCR